MIVPHPDFSDAHVLSKQYLSLPRLYVGLLGGASWSDNHSGLSLGEHKDLVRYEEIALFLEGVASQRSPLPFGLIVHGLLLFARASSEDGQLMRLRRTFAACGQDWRNAGALAGMIGDGLAPSTQAPPIEVVCARLRDTAFPIRWFTGMLNGTMIPGEEPNLLPSQFETHVSASLQQLGDLALGSWLKFGRGPMLRAGEKLVVEPSPSRTWGETVEELLRRPRLAGAVAYVDRMVAALSVPRRHMPQLLPLGGYVDVVTHGSVDRLLPSQHALDDLEFLRRFSENELLYFRREEPPAQNRQEMIVALDQGVRTWGDVRLVLSAAALALTHRAEKKTMPLAIACTSHPTAFDPRTMPAEQLGPILEASDLTRDPGIAIERALDHPSEAPRDVFLLTHPFALAEESVRAAALRLGSSDRLFALTMNAKGQAELAELRRGLPVRLKSFHVDFVEATTPAAKLPVSRSTWSGPVEPYGWPFRIGYEGAVRHFDFDHNGKYLLAIYANAMIHAWEIATGQLEILPRPMVDNTIVQSWLDVAGVAGFPGPGGGFVLLGRHGEQLVAFHYDMAKRSCVRLPLDADHKDGCMLRYMRQWHALLVVHSSSDEIIGRIDMAATNCWSPKSKMDQWEIRDPGLLKKFENNAVQRRLRAATLPLGVGYGGRRNYHLDRKTGRFTVSEGLGPDASQGAIRWKPFIPTTNGQPAFTEHRKIVAAQLAGGVLAVLWWDHGADVGYPALSLFRGPNGDFLRELSWTSPTTQDPMPFQLSRDGHKLAQLRSPGVLEVQLTDVARRLMVTGREGHRREPRLWIGDNSFVIACGRHGCSWHLVNWEGELIVLSEVNRVANLDKGGFKSAAFDIFIHDYDPAEALAGLVPEDFLCIGDGERFRKGARRKGVHFVLDRFGQVMAFDDERRLIFQFYGYGDSWTAWLPDGTRWGRGSVHHWPSTPNASALMGNALRAAAQRGHA